MKIYFAGSISGGRQDKELYKELIDHLSKHGKVLTEHFGSTELTEMGEADRTAKYIHDRDLDWITESDVLIAEVSTPSLGVGYEIAKAEDMDKKTLCLYRTQENTKLSSMIDGSDKVEIFKYTDKEKAKQKIDGFFKQIEQERVIEKTVTFVKEKLAGAEGGHDWWHIERVWKSAKQIAKGENVNGFIVELGALLHDIADSKFHGGDETVGPKKAREFLSSVNAPENVIEHVELIITNISFKGGKVEQKFKSPELDVIQDADRLDALGALGIARTFNYGGHKGHEIYNPEIEPNFNMTKEEYKNSKAPSLNHFYEKLLLLKDRMNTETGKRLAEERHNFMQSFLDQFFKEWNSEATI
mgnify:CR=1 FL=1